MALRVSVRAPLSRPNVAKGSRGVPTSRVPCRRILFVAHSNAADVQSKVVDAIKDAEETCATSTSADCAVAWDTVEELSAAAKKKTLVEQASSDPLEKYCDDNPEADECRIYED